MPAYNEEFGLEILLSRLKRVMNDIKYPWEIVVVNDGSKDRTLKVLSSFKDSLPLKIISFDKNRGITEVFLKGFNHILSEASNEDLIITLDSDNTQSPYVIYDLISEWEKGFNLVIASRFVSGSCVMGVPWFRNILSLNVAYLLKYFFPYNNVSDYSTFYRAQTVELIGRVVSKVPMELVISGEGFSSMARFLLNLCYRGQANVSEVPITLRYDLKEGGTGIRIFRTIFGYFRLIRDLRNEFYK